MSSPDRQELVARLLARKGIARSAAPSICPRPPAVAPPMSLAQQRLWFVDQLDPGSRAYRLTQAIQLTGRLDAGALESALRHVVDRHEALRCGFPTEDVGQSVAVIPTPACVLETVDLSGLTPAAREQRRAAIEHDTFDAPFDLAVPPLWRMRLLKLSDTNWRLLFAVHHIIFDGWSLGIFARELAAGYEAAVLGGTPVRELPPIQYGDYACWQQEQAAAGVWKQGLGHWTRLLEGATRLELAADRPRATTTATGAAYRFVWPPSLAARVQAYARRQLTTPFVVLLAAFGALLGRRTGQYDIVVGSPVANRGRLETEEIIGLFMNMMPLRIRLDERAGLEAAVAGVAGVLADSYPYQDVPFEQIVNAVESDRTLGRHPIFQTAFS